ncbi:hypothetical protein [Brucella anthropi]|uniref:hypothetical protein n=1 Tax=Brucella anthropi TaxID=529 RepID=UPI00296F4FC8
MPSVPVMRPFEVMATEPVPSLIAKMPCPPDEVMDEAFPSVRVIPPIASTLIASPTVDTPNPGCVITVAWLEEEILTEASLPVLEAEPEQLQVSEADGTQSPANDGDDQPNIDANTAADSTEKPVSEQMDPVSQGAIPPAIPLYLPTRPPRSQVASY